MDFVLLSVLVDSSFGPADLVLIIGVVSGGGFCPFLWILTLLACCIYWRFLLADGDYVFPLFYYCFGLPCGAIGPVGFVRSWLLIRWLVDFSVDLWYSFFSLETLMDYLLSFYFGWILVLGCFPVALL